MKTLQKNFTTPEQSEQLLELGVPANSADCFYISTRSRIFVAWKYGILSDPVVERNKNTYLPCWSVGRLIEIAWRCHNTYGFFMSMCTAIGRMFKAEQPIVKIMIDCLFDNTIDFSKLEE